MKNIFYIPILLIPLVLCHQTVDAQQIQLQTTKKTVIWYHGEDWCAPCGDWGWDMSDSLLIRDAKDPNFNAYYTSVHHSSGAHLNTSLGAALSGNTTPFVTAVPAFVVDDINKNPLNDMDFSASTPQGELTAAVDSIVRRKNREIAPASEIALGFEYRLTQDSLILNARTKTLTSLNGLYTVAAYLVEDKVFGFQQDHPQGNVFHKLVLREPLEAGFAGKSLIASTAPTGYDVTNSFKMKLDPNWDTSNFSYMVIVYKYNPIDTTLGIINVTKEGSRMKSGVDTTDTTTSVNHIGYHSSGMNVYPVPAKDNITVSVDGIDATQVYILLSDVTGRKVSELYNGIWDGSKRTFTLPASISSGNYMLHVFGENINAVKKITVRE